MICAITGANGYVGSIIERALIKKGLTVFCLQRKPATNDNEKIISFRLGDKYDSATFRNNSIDVLIHTAYDFQAGDWETIKALNVDSTLSLFEAALEGGVKRIIFISTMSTFEGCKSMYGQAKLAVEKVCRILPVTVVRPGLVYGPTPGGMMGALDKLVSSFPILPLMSGGGQILHLVHETDLADLILDLIHTSNLPSRGPYSAGHSEGKTMRQILELIAASKGKRISFLSIPWQLVYAALKLFQVMKLPIRFRPDNLISLLNQNPNPDFSAVEKIGFKFRPFTPENIKR